MKALEGKVAIVTGGSSGIGAAAALEFARQGARVVIAARREEQGAEVVRQIEALGSAALFIRTDVANPPDIAAMVEATLARFGRLDCAVYNAGTGSGTRLPMAEISEAQWDKVLGVNLKGVFLCMKHEIPAMLGTGGGAIVNVSSAYGWKPSDIGHAHYCASKFGVIGLSRTAAVDYGQRGIRINVVCPGLTHSEMTAPFITAAPDLIGAMTRRHSAQNRIGEAAEIAAAIVWLCSDAASYVNGAVLPVDGGETTPLY